MRRGEHLAGIAHKFGCRSVVELAKANGIKPKDYSSIGREGVAGGCVYAFLMTVAPPPFSKYFEGGDAGWCIHRTMVVWPAYGETGASHSVLFFPPAWPLRLTGEVPVENDPREHQVRRAAADCRFSSGGRMNARAAVLAILLGLIGVPACVADEAIMGTWKLNEANSTFTPAAPKYVTLVYAPAGDEIKVTMDGLSANGKPMHNEWKGKFDGKDYPVVGQGDSVSDTRAYTKIDDLTLEFTIKKDGKTLSSGRIIVAAGGKSRATVSMSAPSGAGKEFGSRSAYDKQ